MSKTPRNPPAEHRFKPGQSGNPKGRPKGARNKVTRGGLARIVMEEAERPGAGGTPRYRAVVRELFSQAAAGELAATRMVLELTADAEPVVADLELDEEVLAARAAADERARAEAAEDEALAMRLAAEDQELYQHARQVMHASSFKGKRFTEAVERARVQIVFGLKPRDDFDPVLAAVVLARLSAEGASPEAADEATEPGPTECET